MALLGFVIACSDEGAPPEVHDACAPLALVAPAATPDQLASLADAAALWRAVGVTELGVAGGASLDVVFAPSAPDAYGYYDGSAVYISESLADAARAIVVAHELGHAVGLVHVTDRASVMNPGNLGVAPSAEDAAAVAALWGVCP